MEWNRDTYQFGTDNELRDIDLSHPFLSQDIYWAKDIPREIVERPLSQSMCFGLYQDGKQLVPAV